MVPRSPRRFESTEAALQAARGHYPTDYLLARGGDRRHPTQWATGEEALKAAIESAGLWKSPLDAVYVWLPEKEDRQAA